MSDVLVIARLALQEAVRRRVLTVVAVLTLASSVLYLVGCLSLKHHVGGLLEVEQIKPIVPATLLGLASFATLFLGSVLSVFLTAGAVRGDADRGLVQPLVVRPVGRGVYLAGRALAAAVVSGSYVLIVSLAATLTTRALFSNLPTHAWQTIPSLVVGVIVVTALTLLVSCLLSTVATGISVLMAYGAGLIAGLLGEIGKTFDASTLTHVADAVSWLLPFEAMYRNALEKLSPTGPLGQLVQLGPLGGASGGGTGLWIYSAAYVVACGVAANWIFGRADL
ncbi:MAG TPA: ABC transporter permease [Mycobacteriales bacterium]|jgi:ABC-type transport system involved in multi-copper enzyme maturation permease subunit|nr:ABC transporter permease [Mycobacteriales bacterium]